jgi:phage baseplate assembly protein gpV
VLFNNSGVVHVQSGTLLFDTGGSATGTFSMDAGATLAFTYQTYTLNANSTLTGAGSVRVDSSGVLTVNAGLTAPHLVVNGGTLNVTGGHTLTVSGSLDLGHFGTLSNSGPVTIATGAVFTWDEGATIAGGATRTIASGATLNITSASSVLLSGGRINNAGTVNWSGAEIDLSTGMVFANLSGGKFNAMTDAAFSGGQLTNAGTFTKTSPVGSGTTQVNGLFTNTGKVVGQSGTLALAGGGSSSGTFSLPTAGNRILFTGSYDLSAGSISGPGTARIVNGTVNVLGTVSAANFALDSGTLNGAGQLTITKSLTWAGGNITNPNGTVQINVGATLNISGNLDKALDGVTVALAGVTNWTGGGNIDLNNGAVIDNQAGAVFSIKNDKGLLGSGSFTNEGTLTKLSGTGATTVASGVDFSNNGGTLNVQKGRITVVGGYTQYGGATVISAGATLASTAGLTLYGGTLSGTGTVSGNLTNDGGEVDPGSPFGQLTVSGSYTQTALGTLTIQIGDTPGSGSFTDCA